MATSGSYLGQSNPGMFIPTTNVWDVSDISSMEIGSPEFTELLVRLYQNINTIALVLNLKDTGYYINQEIINGQQFFSDANTTGSSVTPGYRQVFRMAVDFGALPNATSKSVAHMIDTYPGYVFTRIYGAASKSDGTSFIPIPFSSPTLNENIKIEVTGDNVTITTGIDRTAYTTCYVILEYLKN